MITNLDLPKHLFVDLDGVLIRSLPGSLRLEQPWDAAIETALHVDMRTFRALFFADPFDRVLRGQRSLRQAVDEVLMRMGVDGGSQQIIDRWLSEDSRLNSYVFERLVDLKASSNVAIHIASNQSKERMKYLRDKFTLANLFDKCFFSAELGVLKSSLEFYVECQKIVADDAPVRVFFLDDSAKHVAAAREAGWDARLYAVEADIDLLISDIRHA